MITASEVVETASAERTAQISQGLLEIQSKAVKVDAVLAAARLAIPVVLRAGAAGNVQCREVSAAILKLLEPLIKK